MFLLSSYEQKLLYSILPPRLAFNTAKILLGILSIRFGHTFSPILSHSTYILSYNSRIPTGTLLYCPSLFLRRFHRCSMGLSSGDCAGHGRILNPYSLNQVVALLRLCFGSLSCWKMLEGCYTLCNPILELRPFPSSHSRYPCFISITFLFPIP